MVVSGGWHEEQQHWLTVLLEAVVLAALMDNHECTGINFHGMDAGQMPYVVLAWGEGKTNR